MNNLLSKTSVFSPPQLAELFNVNPSTIKRWVDKGYLQADITPGGHRRVSTAQLQLFIQSYPKYANKSYTIARQLEKAEKPSVLDWQAYYNAMYTEEYEQGVRLIDDAFTAGIPPYKICQQLITPALQHIGDQWQECVISVFDEHRMSFWIRRQIDHLLTLSTTHTKKNQTAILACAPGDSHEIPLLIAHVVLASAGWNVINLGINVPLNTLEKGISAYKPNMVCLSRLYSKKKTDTFVRGVQKAISHSKKSTVILGGHWPKTVQTYVQRAKGIQLVDSLEKFDMIVRK